MIHSPREVFVADHKFIALHVQTEPETTSDTVVLEQVVDAYHEQGVDSSIEVNWIRAAGELLVGSVQKTIVGLCNNFVYSVLCVVIFGNRMYIFKALGQHIFLNSFLDASVTHTVFHYHSLFDQITFSELIKAVFWRAFFFLVWFDVSKAILDLLLFQDLRLDAGGAQLLLVQGRCQRGNVDSFSLVV